jgi:DUF4097 and DUF4098 domain-containing protein YvlB
MMRRVLAIVTVLVVVAAVPAAAASPRPEPRAEQRRDSNRESQTEKISRTVNIGTDGELDVSNISGDIIVTRANGGSATIEAVKTGRGATVEEAREMLTLVTVDIVERGNRVEVRTRYPNSDEWRDRGRGRRNFNVEVAFTIAAPQNTRLTLKSISGSISVKDIAGALSLDSVSGNIRLSSAGRVSLAKTISGNVEILDTRIDGSLQAGTISGEVKLQKVAARSLQLSSVSGNVWLQDVSSDRIDAKTISGEVQFAGDLEPNGRYAFTSHSGSVRVAIGGKSGFQVDATSFSGGINSDLPLTLEGGQEAGRRRRSIRGRFGDGSAVLELTSFSGSISIGKR